MSVLNVTEIEGVNTNLILELFDTKSFTHELYAKRKLMVPKFLIENGLNLSFQFIFNPC